MDRIGMCGDNCTCCPRYTATQKDSLLELESVKTLWVKLGLRDKDFPAEEMACLGCRPENRCAYDSLRSCAKKREINNCGTCPDYPCDRISQVFEASDRLRRHAARVCSREEMKVLTKAFFSKKQIFHRMK
jgi:hypothetical protein